MASITPSTSAATPASSIVVDAHARAAAERAARWQALVAKLQPQVPVPTAEERAMRLEARRDSGHAAVAFIAVSVASLVSFGVAYAFLGPLGAVLGGVVALFATALLIGRRALR